MGNDKARVRALPCTVAQQIARSKQRTSLQNYEFTLIIGKPVPDYYLFLFTGGVISRS